MCFHALDLDETVECAYWKREINSLHFIKETIIGNKKFNYLLSPSFLNIPYETSFFLLNDFVVRNDPRADLDELTSILRILVPVRP